MAPLDFKHMTSAKYRPGEDDAVNYYAQKRKKQYHGNEGKEVKELSMKPDKKLPNLKVPVKGKKGISRFMRKKAIGQAKDDLNASVQSADRKPEKYIKPDGKVGIRMVKTDKEVIKKEQMQVYRVGHKDMSGNVHATTPEDAMRKLRKKGLKGDIKLTHRGSARSMPTRIIPRREELDSKDKPFVKKLIGKLRKGSNTHAKQADDLEKAMKTEAIKHTHAVVDPAGKVAGMTSNERDAKDIARRHKGKVIKLKKPMSTKKGEMMINRPFKEAINHSDANRDAQTHSDGSMSVKKIPSMIKKPGDKHLHLHMKSYHKEKDGQGFAKKYGYKVKNYVKTPSGTRMDIHKEAVEYPHMMYDPKTGNEVKAKTPADHNKYAKMGYTHEKPKNVNEVSKAESDKFNAKVQKILGKINFTHIYNKRGGMFKLPKKVKHELTVKKNDLRNVTSLIKKDTGEVGSMYKKGEIKLAVAESVDEALNLQQRMKRSRLMKRLKTRIKIGRARARRKMANKKTLEKRAMRQARAAIAKKLTRGIPKAELTFARKQEIEKRLDKPALKNRIKRIAKRIFKDVRKKEVQRKKG